jgi:hypothetical protein
MDLSEALQETGMSTFDALRFTHRCEQFGVSDKEAFAWFVGEDDDTHVINQLILDKYYQGNMEQFLEARRVGVLLHVWQNKMWMY